MRLRSLNAALQNRGRGDEAAGIDPAMARAFGAQTAPDYPDRPIRLIVPSPPGGGNDIMARLAAQRLNESWGKSVVVDNRPGAGGAIAFEGGGARRA